MLRRIRLIGIGRALSAPLPEEVTTRLALSPGDTVVVTDTPDGVLLTPGNTHRRSCLHLAAEGRPRYGDDKE